MTGSLVAGDTFTEESRVLDTLSSEGYVALKPGSYSEFKRIMNSIGSTVKITNVEVDDSQGALLNSRSEMPFHTDSPEIDFIGWFCEQQSDEGGASLLIDSREILCNIGQSVYSVLETVQVNYPVQGRERKFKPHPLASNERIYFAPWLLSEILTDEQALAVFKFKKSILVAEHIRILLSAGDALIIDNRRILHGREKILGVATSRKLIRHWVTNREF